MRLTPPQVGRLLARQRVWAWHHVKAGDFGPCVRIGRAWHVDLAAVEEFAGVKFTPAQIAAAIHPRMPANLATSEDF